MEELNYTSTKIFTRNKQGELIEKRVKAAQVCPGLLVTPDKSGMVDLIIEYNGIKWREAQAPAARIDNICKRIPGILKSIAEGHLFNLSDYHKEMHRRIFNPDAPAVMELKKPERKKSAPLPDGAIKTTVLITDFGGKVSEKKLVLNPIYPGVWLNTYKLKRYGERVRIILELDGIYFQGADLGAFVTEREDFTRIVSNAAAHARQNVIEGAAKGIALLVAVNERISTTQPTETPQISTETAEVENVSAEDENPLKKYQREPKMAKCRLVPQWMAKTFLKNGATPLCFNLCEDGSCSITVELNGDVAPLTKKQFRELWPDKSPQPSETPPAKELPTEPEKVAQMANKPQNPTIKKFLHVRKFRTTGGVSFPRIHENGCRVGKVLSEASAMLHGECSTKIVPRLFDKCSTALPP